MNDICEMCDRPVLFKDDDGAFELTGVTLCHRCALAYCLRRVRSQLILFPGTQIKSVRVFKYHAAFELMGIVDSDVKVARARLNLRKIIVAK